MLLISLIPCLASDHRKLGCLLKTLIYHDLGFCFLNLVPFYLISSEESTKDSDKIVNPDDTSADDDSGKEANII